MSITTFYSVGHHGNWHPARETETGHLTYFSPSAPRTKHPEPRSSLTPDTFLPIPVYRLPYTVSLSRLDFGLNPARGQRCWLGAQGPSAPPTRPNAPRCHSSLVSVIPFTAYRLPYTVSLSRLDFGLNSAPWRLCARWFFRLPRGRVRRA